MSSDWLEERGLEPDEQKNRALSRIVEKMNRQERLTPEETRCFEDTGDCTMCCGLSPSHARCRRVFARSEHFRVRERTARAHPCTRHLNEGPLERNHRWPQSGFDRIDAEVRVSDPESQLEDFIFRQRHVVAVQVEE